MSNILNIIADNPSLTKALKDLFQKHFTLDIQGIAQLENEGIGQVIRARMDGLAKIEEAFKEIRSFATVQEEKEQPNPAR